MAESIGKKFRNLSKKVDKESNVYFVVAFDFNTTSFEEAIRVKKAIEELKL